MFTSTLWTISKISHLIDYFNTINRFRCFTNTIIVHNSHEFNYCISKIITSIFIHVSKEIWNCFNIISKFSILPIFMIEVFSCIAFHEYISRTSQYVTNTSCDIKHHIFSTSNILSNSSKFIPCILTFIFIK